MSKTLDKLHFELESLKDHGVSELPLKPKQVVSMNSQKTKTLSDLHTLSEGLKTCQLCRLSKERTQMVFGDGNLKADLMFVGEAPGRDEDEQGVPFVGRAGQLLTKIIESIGLERSDVYICNVVKCRPPQNRNPEPDEIASCSPFLKEQIDTIQPKIICTLGKFAAQTLLQTESPISMLRGQWAKHQSIDLIPTYHPAYLLRNPSAKKEVWEDMKKIHTKLTELTGKTYVLKK